MPCVVQTNTDCIKKEDFFTGYLQLDENVNEGGTLRVTHTDTYGRVVDVYEYEAIPANGKILFSFPLEKTVSLLNFVTVAFITQAGTYAASVHEFIVTPDAHPLDDYSIVMYYAYPDEHQNNLKALGITAGKASSARDMPNAENLMKAQVWWRNNFRFYVDQIALHYYANYHSPVHTPKHKLLNECKAAYKADRTNKSVFVRTPCFYDEEALRNAMARLDSAVSSQKKWKPLIYSTDECGVADLVSAWDFCFDERTLVEMRKWLLDIYGSLEAINREWETDFASINEVTPFTTDEILAREGQNLSPWADHRHFMNKSFADAVKKATEQVHKSDPEALWALVGCQMPSAFGGYDYWLLEKSVDAFEPYNIGNNREIIRSINPAKPCLTTSFGHSDNEVWRLWYQALHGDRGIIIYDERSSYLNEDGTPTELGLKCKPVYNELISGIIKQYTHAPELPAKAAIHYSHASVTAFWKLEISALPGDWVDRSSGIDRFDTHYYRVRESAVKLHEDNQAPYKFAAYGQLENGDFERDGLQMVFLPKSVAMSPKEIQALKRFANGGGTVVADCDCAVMDEHCKLLTGSGLAGFFGVVGMTIAAEAKPAELTAVSELPEAFAWAAPLVQMATLTCVYTAQADIRVAGDALALFTDASGTPAIIVKNHELGRSVYLNLDITDYHRRRLKGHEGESERALFRALLGISAVRPYTPIQSIGKDCAEAGVEIFNRRSGDMDVVAALRNYQLRITELGPPEYQDLSGLQAEFALEIALPEKRAVYDLRKGQFLGVLDTVEVEMPVWEPVILTTFKEAIRAVSIQAPSRVKAGELVQLSAAVDTAYPADMHVLRCVVTAPDGSVPEYYTQNVSAPMGQARWAMPIAKDAVHGAYVVCVKDVATGVAAEMVVEVGE